MLINLSGIKQSGYRFYTLPHDTLSDLKSILHGKTTFNSSAPPNKKDQRTHSPYLTKYCKPVLSFGHGIQIQEPERTNCDGVRKLNFLKKRHKYKNCL